MDKTIANKLSNVASEARRKANYLRMRPSDSGCWNYEQQQGGPEALEEMAQKLETVVAAYFIFANLETNAHMMDTVSRHIKAAIRREKQREETRYEYAELR